MTGYSPWLSHCKTRITHCHSVGLISIQLGSRAFGAVDGYVRHFHEFHHAIRTHRFPRLQTLAAMTVHAFRSHRSWVTITGNT